MHLILWRIQLEKKTSLANEVSLDYSQMFRKWAFRLLTYDAKTSGPFVLEKH